MYAFLFFFVLASVVDINAYIHILLLFDCKKKKLQASIELIILYIDDLFDGKHNVNTYVHRQSIHFVEEI
jgi:hypothetical protein